MRVSRTRVTFALVVWVFSASQSRAAELRFQQGVNGYASTQDVVINSFDPDASENGLALKNEIADDEAENFLESLIRFDKIVDDGRQQIPAGSKITSATLRVTVYNGGSGIVVQRALETWDENSSWKSLNRGLDKFVQTSDAKLGKTNHRKNVRKGTINLDVTASLCAWVENRQENCGWVLKAPTPGGTNSLGIDSSEAPNAATRPLLIVRFTRPDSK
jgi:hypothetical protein